MKHGIKKLVVCVLTAAVTVGFSSSASNLTSETSKVDRMNYKGITSPLASIVEDISEVAAIAVETQEWHQKALANMDGEADIFAEAKVESTVVGKMYNTTIVDVLEKGKEWSKISSGSVEGYVKNEVLAFGKDAVERAKVVCPSVALPVSAEVSVKVEPSNEAQVKNIVVPEVMYPVVEELGEWIKVKDTDATDVYVSSQEVRITRNSQVAKSVEELAAAEKAVVDAAAIKKAADAAAKKAATEAAAKKAADEAAKRATEAAAPAPVASTDDQTLLAAIIYCEAGGEPYEGQVAVGAVILNRVRSSSFPNTVGEVVYQRGQFGPAITGKLDRVLANGSTSSTAIQAAADALAGSNPIGEALYFGNGSTGQQIGNHYFH